MSRPISRTIAVLAALPLSAALAGTASADTFTDNSFSLGPGGLSVDTVTSSSSADGSVRYTRDNLAVGPEGIVSTQTSATAGDAGPGLLAPLAGLLGGTR